MMSIVVDTNVLIDCLRGKEEALSAVREAHISGSRLLCSLVTKAEIYAGLWPEEEAGAKKLLDSFDWVDITDDIATLAGKWAFEYRDSHQDVGLIDYLIAATCKCFKSSFWTLNVKDFPMFDGLKSPY